MKIKYWICTMIQREGLNVSKYLDSAFWRIGLKIKISKEFFPTFSAKKYV